MFYKGVFECWTNARPIRAPQEHSKISARSGRSDPATRSTAKEITHSRKDSGTEEEGIEGYRHSGGKIKFLPRFEISVHRGLAQFSLSGLVLAQYAQAFTPV